MAEHRCRLCTANDRDAIVEHVAEQLWDSRRHGSPEDRPWPVAGGYWTKIYLELADVAVGAMERPDGVAPSSHAGAPRSSAGRAA